MIGVLSSSPSIAGLRSEQGDAIPLSPNCIEAAGSVRTQMSHDMTLGALDPGLESAEPIETDAVPVTRIGLLDILVVTAPGFGVLLSSALGVLLFLR